MKFRINYYVIQSIKENILYILTLIIFFIAFFYMQHSVVDLYFLNKTKLTALTAEVGALESRKAIFESLKSASQDDIKGYNIILNKLIPSVEDYFTIIYALEKISQDTNFIITKYTIRLSPNSLKNILSITITGQGKVDDFLRFLKDYNFSGGRLITIDNIGFTGQNVSEYKLSLNFYNKKITDQITQLDSIKQKDLSYMKELSTKVEFLLKEEDQVAEQVNYPTATDPFSLGNSVKEK